MTRPPVVKPPKKRLRPVRLRAGASAISPGRRVMLRAAIISKAALTAASRSASVKILRGGRWYHVGTMHLRDGRFTAGVRLAKRGRKRSWRFGQVRVPRGLRTLQLRAYVTDAGYSNIVRVRIRR